METKPDLTAPATLSRAWAEVDLDAIEHNVRAVMGLLGPSRLCGVVKADAYGHGVLETSKVLARCGASYLAVSILDEALELRRTGIALPILVLSYTDPKRASEVVDGKVTQTVFDLGLAEALSDEAVRRGRKVRVHAKVDTGMGRVGFMPGYNAVKDIARIAAMPGIVLEGMFTHFAASDEDDPTYTAMQTEAFVCIADELHRVGIGIPILHSANSAAVMRHPETHMDMARVGLAIYGLYPSGGAVETATRLIPALSLKSSVVMVKKMGPGMSVSYGRRFTTRRESVMATVPIGYADGFSRIHTGSAHVLIGGMRHPVVGAICMDQCVVDVTDAAGEVSVGDEVVIIGGQGGGRIEAEELAEQAGTINYEVACLVGRRVPRAYIKDGKVRKVVNYLFGE
ncbi:MAG: alanine racemase [Oscillospiraceae bacterium]|nr:alanine racemase [Oscillospiraceae bacterium]